MLVCVSGDGGELLQQDVLTQRGQRHVLPHVQTDRADLEETGTGDGTGVRDRRGTRDRRQGQGQG